MVSHSVSPHTPASSLTLDYFCSSPSQSQDGELEIVPVHPSFHACVHVVNLKNKSYQLLYWCVATFRHKNASFENRVATSKSKMAAAVYRYVYPPDMTQGFCHLPTCHVSGALSLCHAPSALSALQPLFTAPFPGLI